MPYSFCFLQLWEMQAQAAEHILYEFKACLYCNHIEGRFQYLLLKKLKILREGASFGYNIMIKQN